MDPCESKIIDKDQMRFFKQHKTQLIVSLYNRYHYYYLMENQIIFFSFCYGEFHHQLNPLESIIDACLKYDVATLHWR